METWALSSSMACGHSRPPCSATTSTVIPNTSISNTITTIILINDVIIKHIIVNIIIAMGDGLLPRQPAGDGHAARKAHARVLSSFQQPTFQTLTKHQ